MESRQATCIIHHRHKDDRRKWKRFDRSARRPQRHDSVYRSFGVFAVTAKDFHVTAVGLMRVHRLAVSNRNKTDCKIVTIATRVMKGMKEDDLYEMGAGIEQGIGQVNGKQ